MQRPSGRRLWGEAGRAHRPCAALVACETWAAQLATAPGTSATAAAAAEFYAATLRDLEGEADFLARLSSETNRRLALGGRPGPHARVRSELRILGALLRPLLAPPRTSVCGLRAGNRGLACGVIAVESSPEDASASQEGLLPAFDDTAARYLAARRQAAAALREVQGAARAAETTASGPVAAALAAYAGAVRRMEAEGPSVVRRRLRELAPAGLPLTPPQLHEIGALRALSRLLSRRRERGTPPLADDAWRRTLEVAREGGGGGEGSRAPRSAVSAPSLTAAPVSAAVHASGGKEGRARGAHVARTAHAALAAAQRAAVTLLGADAGWKRALWVGVALLWAAAGVDECVRRARRRRNPEPPPPLRAARQWRRPGARPRRRGREGARGPP